uniref:Uncharacterized protein n=1 Tax=Arundo donax TaxID=35708 RepID=A0A0A9BGP0_ARUDO
MLLTKSRSLQTAESVNLCFTVLTVSPFMYLALTMSCQRPFSFSNLHHHLQS